MTETIEVHPFQRTLGPGPYRFIGMFTINIEAGKMGRPYVNPHEMHTNFVSGCGTCAHCGHAILNVCQVMIGNGEVYGVGTDCIEKCGLPVRELNKIERAKLEHAKKLRLVRKAKKGDLARSELADLIASHAEIMKAIRHPSSPAPTLATADRSLYTYAEWVLKNSNDGGIVFALNRVKLAITKGNI